MKLRYCVLCFLLVLSGLVFPATAMAQKDTVPLAKRNDFKVTLLSLGSGSTRLTFEHAFNSLNSAELTLGIVGLGWDWMNESHPGGLLVKLAFKWRVIPSKALDNWLAGFYVKPEFVWAQFRYDNPRVDGGAASKCPESTLQMALLAECGYQIVWNWFVFDVYTGLGPSFGTGNLNNYYHSFMLFPDDGWLAFTAGFRVGVAF